LKKILIVDDEPDILKSLKDALERRYRDFRISVASDGQEALKKIQEEAQAPDLIILDLVMPRLSGEELLPILRKNDKTAGIPIIISTVRRETSSLVNLMEMGATDYLMKPYDVRELFRVVQTYLI
jgi:DNA-binding response OmpR family regulator